MGVLVVSWGFLGLLLAVSCRSLRDLLVVIGPLVCILWVSWGSLGGLLAVSCESLGVLLGVIVPRGGILLSLLLISEPMRPY